MEETDKKLNMSLDALINKRRKTESAKSKGKPPQSQQTNSRQTAQADESQGFEGAAGGSGQRPPRNGDLKGRQQGFTNSGLMMPNFGMPFGDTPPLPMHMMGMGMGAMNGAHPPLPGMPFPSNLLLPPGLNPNAQPFQPHVEEQKISVPQARLEKVSGEVRVEFRKQDIVRVSKDGTISINTTGVRGPAMFMALNAILKVVDISITRPKNAKPENNEWSVSDGRSLSRFRDGMTLPARGYEARMRGKKIMDSFGEVDPSAAAAATAASNAAARAAGIFPKTADPSRNQGLHPVGGGPPSRPFYRPPGGAQPRAHPGEANGTADSDTPGSGGKSQAESDRIRRLAAKGRYRPY